MAAAAAADGVWWVTGMILLVPRPHSCQLYSFYGLLPSYMTSHILLTAASGWRWLCCDGGIAHMHPSMHTFFLFTKPIHCDLSLRLSYCTHLCTCIQTRTHMHTHTSSCHLDSDTRVIGLCQEIYITDKWVLLGLTGEKIEWLKSRGGLKMKGIREELQRRECICT